MNQNLPEGQGDSSLTIHLLNDEEDIIPDIEIKILNTSKKILNTSLTDSSGTVIFNLKEGDYFVRINKQTGYKTFNDQPVTINGNTSINIVLELE